MEDQETQGSRVRALRKAYRQSQTQFGSYINLSHVAVGNIEIGKTANPHKGTLDSIVKVFGTTHEWLADGKGEMLPNGLKELSLEIQSSENPYKDALVLELNEKANTWKETAIDWKGKYEDLFMRFNTLLDKMPMGKSKALNAKAAGILVNMYEPIELLELRA